MRWLQAYKLGMAPNVLLKSTNERTLNFIPLEALIEYAVDYEQPKKEKKSKKI